MNLLKLYASMVRKYAVMVLTSALLFICLGIAISGTAQIKKSPLNVLYVGGSGNLFDLGGTKLSAEEKATDVKRRMDSFEGMLNKYFSRVKAIHLDEYKATMSAGFDVTIIDAMPPRAKSGEQVNILPDDFDAPVLFIAESSVRVPANHGVKFDWYCLCLRADAYNLRTQHQIFKGPFPVNITTEPKPLPFEASIVNYREDNPLPSTVPMWRVQTGSYDDESSALSERGISLRPGLICHPGGFEDSPDAEYIAGGSSAKDGNALAIGRHGNFFHWGFAASPEHLTPQGETVLANAIVYTSKFKGKKVIARKFSDRIQTTYDITGRRDAASKKGNDLLNEYHKILAVQLEATNKKLQEKKDKGGKLDELEEAILKNNTQLPEQQDLEAYLRYTQRDLFSKFGTDLNAYRHYYNENMPYFYSDKNGRISIDEDLKSLKIKKNDPQLLDAAIRLWEKEQDVEKAKRILGRYTLATFTKPEQWRKWYEENKSLLFFTESGGYYFLINSDKYEEGNDYRKKQKLTAYKQIAPGETTDEEPVSVALGIVPLDNGNKEVVVRFKIHPGYHIYSYVSSADPFIKTEVKITLPEGYKEVGELKMPTAILYNPSGTSVFKEEITFVQEVTGKGTADILCGVSYQCCNDNICYPPVETQLKIKK